MAYLDAKRYVVLTAGHVEGPVDPVGGWRCGCATITTLERLEAKCPVVELLHAAAKLPDGWHRIPDVDSERPNEPVWRLADVGSVLVVADDPRIQELE